ncbi:response regulator transcription factor [Rhizobium sp. NTR19]|uniref:Response regulator transcription factor n=1 Tax=Neorhizobium turbinariae TaxID=2937795 RepID=A0ABT0IXB0_9HYPH|nr:response regulator transcription factor [Neorhizobium turbinariae]MCK8782480.1 response regulator transcription factor [Neorhizobium turbinariae]
MQAAHNTAGPVGVDLAVCAFERMNTIKTLLIICSPGTISAAMTAAIESEFPWLSVEIVYDLPSALNECEHPVQLILADAVFASGLYANWPSFLSVHQEATPALLCHDDGTNPLQHPCMRDAEWVQGIVPFNVNLDVFLSALRIILKGGRYFPTTGSRAPAADTAPALQEKSEANFPSTTNGQVQGIEKLTKRENEILACMAMGNQNKIIAATLGLSEHTVKIHIHNIITKLGVHNRTEVVARYFEYKRKEGLDHANKLYQSDASRSLPRNE